MYASPVLFSGLGSLVLSENEKNMINQHHKDTISNLQRLIPLTPRPVVHFLAGVLPGTALLHLRQLSIFGMITRLPGTILHKHSVKHFGVQNCITRVLAAPNWVSLPAVFTAPPYILACYTTNQALL